MRYLLDAAVVTEMLRPAYPSELAGWVRVNEDEGLAIAATTLVQLQGGLARAPSERKVHVTRWLMSVESRFRRAVLPFDAAAARPCARLLAQAEAAGVDAPIGEAMMAAIAEARGLILAARATPLLSLWGGPMVDPWTYESA